MASAFTDISTENADASSSSDVTTIDDFSSSTKPKPSSEDLLHQQLIAVIKERDEYSAQLASILSREIESSFTSADSIAQSSQSGEFLQKQIENAMAKSKELFDENASLRVQLATAQVQLQEKKRLEDELQRLKGFWGTLNNLGAITSLIRKKEEKPSPSASPAIDTRRDELMAALKEENSKLKADIAQMNVQMENLQKMQHDASMESVRVSSENDLLKLNNQHLLVMEGENQKLQNEINRLKNDNMRLAHELTTTTHARQYLETEVLRLNTDLHRYAEIGGRIEQMSNVNIRIMEENEKLKVESNRIKNDLTANYGRLQTANEEIMKLRESIGQTLKDNRRLQEELAAMKVSCGKLENEVGLLHGENFVANKDLEHARRQAAVRQQLIVKYQTALRKNAVEIAQLKVDLSNVKIEWQQSVHGIMASLNLQQNPLDAPWVIKLAEILDRQKQGVVQNAESTGIVSMDTESTAMQMDTTEPLLPSQYGERINQLTKEKDEWQGKYQRLTEKIRSFKPKGAHGRLNLLKGPAPSTVKQTPGTEPGTSKDTPGTSAAKLESVKHKKKRDPSKEPQKETASIAPKEIAQDKKRNSSKDPSKPGTSGAAKENVEDMTNDASKATPTKLTLEEKKKLALDLIKLKQTLEQKIGHKPKKLTVYEAANSVWDSISGVVSRVVQENSDLKEEVRNLRRAKYAISAAKKKPLIASGSAKLKKPATDSGTGKVKKAESLSEKGSIKPKKATTDDGSGKAKKAESSDSGKPKKSESSGSGKTKTTVSLPAGGIVKPKMAEGESKKIVKM